jgi:hypothetical protein
MYGEFYGKVLFDSKIENANLIQYYLGNFKLAPGELYEVTFDGNVRPYIAENGQIGDWNLSSNYPYYIFNNPNNDVYCRVIDNNIHDLKIIHYGTNINYVPNKYIKDMYGISGEKEICRINVIEGNGYESNTEYKMELKEGEKYKVIFDGVEYICTAWMASNNPAICLGNGRLYGNGVFNTYYENNMPFLIAYNLGFWDCEVFVEDWLDHEVIIYHLGTNIIDKKYIPNIADWNQKDVHGSGYIKNKPFDSKYIYSDNFTPIIENLEVDTTSGGFYQVGKTYNFELNRMYKIIWDNEEYYEAFKLSSEGSQHFGDPYLSSTPFMIGYGVLGG